MKDDSRQDIKYRQAIEGEVLLIYRFADGSKVLTSPQFLSSGVKSRHVASHQETRHEPSIEYGVCVPDGAELVMTGISDAFQFTHNVSPTEVVVFHRMPEDSGDRDVERETVEFRNGVFAALQELEAGQRLGVLALSAAESMLRREKLNAFIVP